MKRDLIIHARYKSAIKNNNCYVDDGLSFSPLKGDEKKSHVIDSNGGITLAIVKQTNNTLKWGIALCNKTDIYNKRIGRSIAIGRANKYGLVTSDIEFDTAISLAKKLINHIYEVGYDSLNDICNEEQLLKLNS